VLKSSGCFSSLAAYNSCQRQKKKRMDTTMQLSENSHQGFDGLKAALCPASMEAKWNTASGMPVCLWREGISSRSSGKERDAETGLDNFEARYHSADRKNKQVPPVPITPHYVSFLASSVSSWIFGGCCYFGFDPATERISDFLAHFPHFPFKIRLRLLCDQKGVP
jgi:hypothetical protein